MAQPLCCNVPPICLTCLGTNNKFFVEDLLPRWRYIVGDCNISILSFGANGDSRVMKCMKESTSLMAPLSVKDVPYRSSLLCAYLKICKGGFTFNQQK